MCNVEQDTGQIDLALVSTYLKQYRDGANLDRWSFAPERLSIRIFATVCLASWRNPDTNRGTQALIWDFLDTQSYRHPGVTRKPTTDGGGRRTGGIHRQHLNFELAALYQFGQGVEQDYAHPATYYCQAAERRASSFRMGHHGGRGPLCSPAPLRHWPIKA